jgi:arylsulfatase A-like enzyme
MARPPNIVLILTDDHAQWALGSYGNRDVRSPNLDRLASEGVRFANAFTPSPVCSPARACLHTGRTPSQVGIHDWLKEPVDEIGLHDWLAGETTLAELLSEAGYFCGLSGKWHMGRSRFTPRGFSWYFGLPSKQGVHVEEFTYVFNERLFMLNGNKTEFITDFALQFLNQAPRDKPFFLNIGYVATHAPFDNQDPELVSSYDNFAFHECPIYRPHPWRHNEGFTNDENYSKADIVRCWQNYYAAVTDIDRNVQRIVDRLTQYGVLDNTLIIYTSDHGMALGQHGFFGKGNGTRPLNMYETSIRVPLIMRWSPSLPAGRVVDRCVDHYDTFQTILEIAGIDMSPAAKRNRSYPGRSLVELAETGKANGWNDARIAEYGDLRMIRTPAWKLVKRYPNGPDELFNLADDPGETNNLIDCPKLADIKKRLTSDLEHFYRLYENPEKSGLSVKTLRQHNLTGEAWRDGWRERLGLQVY